MLAACPHCNFLAAHAPGQPRPLACPRCGQALGTVANNASGDATTPAASGATGAPPLATLLSPAVAPSAVEAAVDAEALDPAGRAASSSAPEPPLGQPTLPAQPDTAADRPRQLHSPAIAVGSSASPAPAPVAAARARTPVASSAFARWQWALVALLGLLLVLQVLLADRARLAADAQWRPLLEQACGVLGCSLPPWHEPSAFSMVQRSVRPSGAAGALRVDATFRNDARWAQPWPALQLSLADADGRTLGSGVFTPAQYLDHAQEGLLAP